MIQTHSAPIQNGFQSAITCITYFSNKIGPRLVGTPEDWGMDLFSKKTLFDLIHDSLLVRSKNTMLYLTDQNDEKWRAYITRIQRDIADFRYKSSKYAYCILVPDHFKYHIRFQSSLDSFDWTTFMCTMEIYGDLNQKILDHVTFSQSCCS